MAAFATVGRIARIVLAACCLLSVTQAVAAVDPQADAVKAGAVLFGTSGCTFCHGAAGMGTDRAPSLRDVRKRLNDEQIRRQIHDGGRMMPPFGEALTEEEIAHLSEFLRANDAWGLVPAPASK